MKSKKTLLAAVGGFALLTGSAQEGGFKGIGGQFVRRNLQAFGVQQALSLRFTRSDTGASIDAAAEGVVQAHDVEVAQEQVGEAEVDEHADQIHDRGDQRRGQLH